MLKYLIIAFALVGCYTSQKAIKQANKAMKEHPADVLPLFRANFPCNVTGVDTAIFYTDTLISFNCPNDYVSGVDTIVNTEFDTVTHVIYKAGKTITISKVVQLPSKVITKYVRDSSLTKELALKLNDCNANNAIVQKELETAKNALKTRNIAILILLLLLIIAILTHFIRKK